MSVVKKREIGPSGILQPWVAELGLRYQGVLLSVIRGPDGEPKHCPIKILVRAIRGKILFSHAADASKASSFIEDVDQDELWKRFEYFFNFGLDHYNTHYLFHLIHALQVIGCFHPDIDIARVCLCAYWKFCTKLHVKPETKEQLKQRLEADEEAFAESN